MKLRQASLLAQAEERGDKAAVQALQTQLQQQHAVSTSTLLSQLDLIDDGVSNCWCWESVGTTHGPYSTKLLLQWLRSSAITRFLLVSHHKMPNFHVSFQRGSALGETDPNCF